LKSTFRTQWSLFPSGLTRDHEHRFIPAKTINMNGRRRNTFPIDKKTRDLIKRKKRKKSNIIYWSRKLVK
jgi:hypothetical protein